MEIQMKSAVLLALLVTINAYAAPPTLVGAVHAADWQYVSEIDRMTDERLTKAVLISGNSLSLPPPDDGENHAFLQVRQRGANEPEVLFHLAKGRILCAPENICSIKARFDDDKPVMYFAERPSNHSENALFLIIPRWFIERAKKAKSILVQVPVKMSGDQVLEFRGSTPLKWELPPIKRKGKAK
jgi:hypothetical protein